MEKRAAVLVAVAFSCGELGCGAAGSQQGPSAPATSADCTKLGLRYAAAFEDAQHCTPGVDTCSYAAESPWEDLPDGGRTLATSACMNSCGSGNLNPRKAGPLMTAVDEYRAHGCQQLMGCMCPATESPPYSCRATLDGGICAP
jgi:hypothetical protein